MYELLFRQECGMFTPLHFATIVTIFTLLALCFWLSRNLQVKQVSTAVFWLGLLAVILEVLKILNRVQRGYDPGRWIPLFYCSLFIFAVWLPRLPWEPMKRMGYAFMTMGGALAGIFFIFYPSTSLASYPLISFDSLHSLLYHVVMCYCGVMILWKGLYRPRWKDSVLYFLFVGTACVLALYVNARLDTNCMFLKHPYGLPLLQPLMDYSKVLYIAVAAFAQSGLMFWVNFGLYRLTESMKKAAAA